MQATSADKGFRGFYAASSQTMTVLELVEAPLDHVAQSVDGHVDGQGRQERCTISPLFRDHGKKSFRKLI